ncbi:hypothetical protein KY290_019658 [Solanum tuberosum]|uniref:Uncharacterized protein n=1 Tax=Solanum tuberosum TaxID=4113 RepID=A0ABQ7VKP7_SOLTU|nr:hypothetical protein KY284_016209 [Solanum tuberosum]KAH0763585.1 hypothetical protein KY290_019658 [Solanum tuberosum]
MVLKKYLDLFVIVFFDDILIYYRIEEEHATHLRVVLQTLKDRQLFENKGSEAMAQTHIFYSFLGLAGYYRRFVEGFSSIDSSLTKLTQKKYKFQWSDEYEKNFSELKPRVQTRRWLEFLKDYDMNVLYHPGKANVVAYAHSRLSMCSIAHVEKERKELAKDVHRLDRLGICLMNISDGGVIMQHGPESSLVAEVGELRQQILTEAHNSRYSIHPGATKMYHDLWEFFWWNGMKRDIDDFVAKFPNCQQVNVEHHKPRGMTQEINIPTWKWEVINMYFITGLPRTRRQHESIWVIVDRVTKSAHFLAVKTTDSTEDYAKLYINEIVRLHGVPLSIISDRKFSIYLSFLEVISERSWYLVGEALIGPDSVHDAMENVQLTRDRLKTAQSRQKSYTNVRRRDMEFQIDDWVFLKLSPMKGVMRFEKKGNLSPRYVGPYRILKRVGKMAYELELPAELAAPVFHISLLKKCMGDPTSIVLLESVVVKDSLTYKEVQVEILDRQV